MSSERVLIIPAEEQSREFDAKLLLACVAAESGFRAVLGSRSRLHELAARLPRGTYFAKSFRAESRRMFDIYRDLGCDIAALDEEALVPFPDEIYFERRVSPQTLARISRLFAWGPASAELFRRCPGYGGAPIHVTGNPRLDLLRPELRPFFDAEVAEIRRRLGDFLLINTNFGTLNHFVPSLGWMNDVEVPEQGPEPDDYWQALTRHRRALFAHFRRLVPRLARAFPKLSIVVRPHPVESHEPWRAAASGCENVHVVHEGNVVPWLLACRALVHNGCTTGIEAWVLGTPAIAYQPVSSERLDFVLPNRMSRCAASEEELCEALGALDAGSRGGGDDSLRHGLARQHMVALDGPLACQRIVDALVESGAGGEISRRPLCYARGWLHAQARAGVRVVRRRLADDRNSSAYQRHRFPGVSPDGVRERIHSFGRLLSRFGGVRVAEHSEHVFLLQG